MKVAGLILLAILAGTATGIAAAYGSSALGASDTTAYILDFFFAFIVTNVLTVLVIMRNV